MPLHNLMCDSGHDREYLILILPPDIDEMTSATGHASSAGGEGKNFTSTTAGSVAEPVGGDKPSAVAKKSASLKSVSFGVLLTFKSEPRRRALRLKVNMHRIFPALGTGSYAISPHH